MTESDAEKPVNDTKEKAARSTLTLGMADWIEVVGLALATLVSAGILLGNVNPQFGLGAVLAICAVCAIAIVVKARGSSPKPPEEPKR